MGIACSSGGVTANVTGSVTTSVASGVSVSYSASNVSGTIDIATVPANHEWDILGYSINQGGNVDVTYILGGTTHNKLNGTALNNSAINYGFIPGFFIDTLTAGEKIQRTNSTGIVTNVTTYYIDRTV